MSHRLTLTLLVAGALLTSPVHAQLGPDPDPNLPSDPGSPDAVSDEDLATARLLLSAHHGIPEAAAFDDALDAPVPVLRVLATDPNVFPLYRQRALSALGYWADQWLGDELSRLATDPASGDLMQHHAVLLLAQHFGVRSVGVVEAWLTDDDVQRRLTAIEAIDAHGGDALQTLLHDQLSVEDHPVVQQRIEEALEVR